MAIASLCSLQFQGLVATALQSDDDTWSPFQMTFGFLFSLVSNLAPSHSIDSCEHCMVFSPIELGLWGSVSLGV